MALRSQCSGEELSLNAVTHTYGAKFCCDSTKECKHEKQTKDQRQKNPLNKAVETLLKNFLLKTKFLHAYQNHVREAAMLVLFKFLKIIHYKSFLSQLFKFI